MTLPAMSQNQARKLTGKRFMVGKSEFFFENKIVSGGQAIAIPLKNRDGRRIAFFRTHSATSKTPVNIERTSWLIGQRLHLLSKTFTGVPQLWVDTRKQGRPSGIDFDFDGAILGLAIGRSWKSFKQEMELTKTQYPDAKFRLQLASGLIQRLASLERLGPDGLIHGDLSDANIIVDRNTASLNLIDFECFIFESSTLSNSKLKVKDGGSMGTKGYVPDWHLDDYSPEGEPFGDRFARDMLLIEILGFREDIPCDESPLHWEAREKVLAEIEPLATGLKLSYLQDPYVFEWWEEDRFTSIELAENLGLPVENHSDKLLTAPPRRPSGIKPTSQSNDHQPVETEPTEWKFPELQWPSLDQLPSWEELPKSIVEFFQSEADHLAIFFGQSLFKLWKTLLIALPTLVLAVAWMLDFVLSLRMLNLPTNLIACRGLIYVAYRGLQKLNIISDSNKKSK